MDTTKPHNTLKHSSMMLNNHLNNNTMNVKEKRNQAVITRDFTSNPEIEKMGIKSMKGRTLSLPYAGSTRKQFNLYDDDDNLYYSGFFYDDDYCENQDALLSWAMYDSGCTRIMVREGRGKFEQEIA